MDFFAFPDIEPSKTIPFWISEIVCNYSRFGYLNFENYTFLDV